MNKILRGCGFAAVTMLALGCREQTSSQFVKTGGIAAEMSVTADNPDTSLLRVELAVGGPNGTLVNLDAGDKLTATAGTETQTLASSSPGVYEATFKTTKRVDFTVSLDRVEEQDAPKSTAMLADPFLLSSPAEDGSYSRSMDAFQIIWTPTVPHGDGGHIDISGSCIQATSMDVVGTEAMVPIDVGTLKSLNEMMPESCKVTVTVSFGDHGTIDPAFDPDSSFNTTQSRTVTFNSDP